MRIIYNKLVRDKFIEIWDHDVAEKISMSGYQSRFLNQEETLEALKHKLHEEIDEVLEVYGKDNVRLREEIADVIEVLNAMLHLNNGTLEEALKIKDAKNKERGGFETGLYLESIDYINGKEPK